MSRSLAGAQIGLQRDDRALELLHLEVARQRAVPHERDAREVGLHDDRVQPAVVVHLSAAVVEASLEPEVKLRQREAQAAAGREAMQHHRFSAAQKLRCLLIDRRALVIAIVHVLGEQRLARLHPLVVVGSGQCDARLPVARDRAEPGRGRPVAPRADQVLGVFEIGQAEAGRIAIRHREAGAHRIAPLPVFFRCLRFRIDTTEGPLVDQRHPLKRLGRRRPKGSPRAITDHAQHLLDRADPETHVDLRCRGAGRRVCVSDHQHVGGLLRQHQIGVVLDAALARLAVVLGDPQHRWLLLRNLGAAIELDVEGRLDRHQPDLRAIPVTNPAALGGEGRAVVDLPHEL